MIVGIDLGTTNCSLSYVDEQGGIVHFSIPQLLSEGVEGTAPSLPSFCYLPFPEELEKEGLRLKWVTAQDRVIGRYAKERGAATPTKLIESAKSWLCHSAAHRREKILPLEAAEEKERLSPVEASTLYLSHLRDAWNRRFASADPDKALEEQTIILTVPASFDESARHLTMEAAEKAGIKHLYLLEEPQAAFYHWLKENEKTYQQVLKEGDWALICDVGGGTSDFSLIKVVEEEGKLGFRRVAVGDHLLLGGDNMDLALAHYLAEGLSLTNSQWHLLKHEAKAIKEKLFDPGFPEKVSVTLQGTGSKLIEGSLLIERSAGELRDLLLEGFWKKEPFDKASHVEKNSGIKSLGLPYEKESSVIRHLAAFLATHPENGQVVQPDAILFNGGVFKAEPFQKRVLESLREWFPEKSLTVLEQKSLDLAVSFGAAYYGKVKEGKGIKVMGGTPVAYFLEVDQENRKAVTLLPRHSRENHKVRLERTFYLQTNSPVEFSLFTSHVRIDDPTGSIVAVSKEEMHPLPKLQTVLKWGKTTMQIPVRLTAMLTEVGTVEMQVEAIDTPHRWKLEFHTRKTASVKEEHLAEGELEPARKLILQTYADKTVSPKELIGRLEAELKKPKWEWHLNQMRKLWEPLKEQAEKRHLSKDFRERWWNLAGFFLRPGCGYPLDEMRINDLWKVFLADPKNEESLQRWIAVRRVAGGLKKGQQSQIASRLLPLIYKNGKLQLKGKQERYPYTEKLRTFASLELIDTRQKIDVGNALIKKVIEGKEEQAEVWALSRLGARHPLYGSIANIVPKKIAEEWIKALLEQTKVPSFDLLLSLGRKTEFKELNIDAQLIEKIALRFSDKKERELSPLFTVQHLSEKEEEEIYGEKLPAGIKIYTF